MRSHTDPLVLTSWGFAFPAYLWAAGGCVVEAMAVALAAFSAVVYHRHREPTGIILRIDQVLAIAALVITLSRYFVSAFRVDVWFFAVVVLSVQALCVYGVNRRAYARRDWEVYEALHLLWHLLVIMGQCCLAVVVGHVN